MSLKAIVNERVLWDALLVELDERISFAHKQMEQCSTSEDLFRYQGDIRTLRKLKQLRDKVNGQQN
jgi:hypothetical protein